MLQSFVVHQPIICRPAPIICCTQVSRSAWHSPSAARQSSAVAPIICRRGGGVHLPPRNNHHPQLSAMLQSFIVHQSIICRPARQSFAAHSRSAWHANIAVNIATDLAANLAPQCNHATQCNAAQCDSLQCDSLQSMRLTAMRLTAM